MNIIRIFLFLCILIFSSSVYAEDFGGYSPYIVKKNETIIGI